MTTLPENSSVAIDELESAITEMESHLESVRAERDEAKARQVELELENANLRRELNFAREQQKASAGILSVISSSVADTNPVFESILSSIKHLFDGEESLIFLSDEDGLLRIAAARGASAEAARERFPIPVEGTASELAIRERRLVRSADVQNDPDVPIKLRETARRVGQNYSMAIAPMLWEDNAIGTIFVGRSSMVPFTDRECELLNSFADQAVIAIQNARLFNETREALERQTATAEILKVIASSPSEVQPVFEAIASNAKQLLGGFSTTVLHFVGDELHLVAYTPTSPEADEALKSSFPRKLAEFPTFALVRNGETIQFADTEADEVPDANRELARLRGFRSVLFTPLMNRGAPVGMISVTREAPGAFASHHVQLLQTFAAQAVIAIENVRLFNETKEALERQTATAEILKVIASSPSDVLPVFEAIVGSAKRLLGGFSAAVFRFIDGTAHLQAITPTNPAADEVMKNSFPRPIADFQSFAMVRVGQTVQTPDTETLSDDIRDIARARGFRSMLLTPLLREGTPIGLISVTRVEPGPFSAHFVQLLQTFADQAVIAIENTRLFNETKEALERQTATADILKVIASSPSDVQPVFDAIVDSANRLIGGFSAAVFRYIDGKIHLAAFTPTDAAGDAALQSSFPLPLEQFPPYHPTRAGAPAELPDTEAEPAARDIARARGYRSMLFAPLMNEGKAVGIITVTRVEPGPFGEQHTRLLQMFADQAVIALKNVGLFNEVQARTEDLSESLRQQTAVGDVLKTISRSTFELQPVLDTLVNSAAQLCDADMAFIMRRVGDEYRAGAAVGYTEAYIDFLANHPLAVNRGTATGRAVLERSPVQILDVVADPDYTLHETTTLAGQRTTLGVPLLREDEPIGVIVLARRRVEAFTEKQIDLVTTFADQAVIAIENVRLFNEVRQRTEDLTESLQQQTATADVLKVISRSAFDLETVLNTLTESAARLCNADMAAVTRQHPEGGYHHATRYNFPPEWDRFVQSTRVHPGRGSLVGRVLLEGSAVQIPDVLADPEYAFPEQQRAGGYRTLLGVPLLREGQPIGVLFLGRTSVEPFSDKQVELVSTFADQAVIAIENVRLFDEVQAKTRDLEGSLQQQTATADVLKVISRSAFDLQTVLDALLSSACRLCEADIATIRYRDRDDGDFRLAATFGAKPEWVEQFARHSRKPGRESIFGRTIVDGHTVHIPDVLADPELQRSEAQKLMGFRAALGVPLTRERQAFGVITLFRFAVGSFEERQIELMQTFADQAVIAIENVRLFDEVQAKKRDLEEALTYQTGSANILSVIAASPTDVKPVLQAIVESACDLCEAYDCIAFLKDGDYLRFSAHHGPIPMDFDKWPINRKWVTGRSVVDKRPVHVHDLMAEGDEFPDGRDMSARMGHRTMVAVPLLRDGESIGAIILRRTEVNPFSDKQVNLLQTFADQAVIAIGNVRLFEEVQARTRDLTESLQQQTATGDVLKVIASSPTDVKPALQAIVESACAFCDAYDAGVLLKIGDDLHFSAHHGPIPTGQEPRPISREWVVGRSVVDKVPVQVPDFQAAEAAEFPEGQRQSREQGHRCTLSVPLLREGEAIGALALRRLEPVAFSDKQITLLKTFADQAVIAIGNVRLFEEVQARTRELTESLEQQTATSEVLQAISSSQGDLAPVFDAMLGKSMQLCGADFGVLNTYDGSRFHTAATCGLPPAYDEFRRRQPLDYGPGTAPALLLQGEPHVEILHLLDSEAYRRGDPNRRALVDIGGARSLLAVPLLKDKRVVGNVMIFRQEDSPFSEKQIALLKQFAAQAVIAIENARLLNELRQRTNDLSRSLDDLRTAQDRLVQTEKLASLGQLTAGIAHEIKNPLNFVNNFAALSTELTEELNDALKQAEVGEKIRVEVDELTGLLMSNLEKIAQHGRRADSIVKNMLLHSREGGGEHRPSDINALVDESLNLAYHGARAEKPGFNVTLERDFDPTAGQVDLFPQEMTRVLLNLVSNGFYAVTKRNKEAGEPGFEPTLRASTKNLGDAVEIRIRDNGTGIQPDVREKMFNPFFTTKPAGEGTGLGLSMSHDIIAKQHGGTIDVNTEQGHFTEFRIVLPRTSNFAEKSRG
jgi:GAF domain-containing protein